MNRPQLPDFTRPPVNEVALSIQFEALGELRAIHLGSLWQKFGGRKHFPSVEEQPTIPLSFETFQGSNTAVGPQFEIMNLPPLPRFLFVSNAGTEVIQVQPDRFTFNWRKRSPSDIYPRYEAIETKFLHFFEIFASFLKEEKIGLVKLRQAEITYVNQIPQVERGGRIDRVISILSNNPTDTHLNETEQVRLLLTSPIKRNGLSIGRLHIDAAAVTQGDAPELTLVLLARGKPDGTGINAGTDFLRLGRAAIVKSFASITSTEMHKAWGRTDDASPES